MKVYTTNNAVYLGTKDETTITGFAVTNKQLTQEDFANYLKAKQLQELVEVEVGVYQLITRELSRREKLDLKMVKAEFKEAKDMAEDWLVVKAFDELRGK